MLHRLRFRGLRSVLVVMPLLSMQMNMRPSRMLLGIAPCLFSMPMRRSRKRLPYKQKDEQDGNETSHTEAKMLC